jgi:RNA polymerase sigma factor (sigma-70 family)
MTMTLGDQDTRRVPAGAAHQHTALAFEVFYTLHQATWVRYAHVETGSRQAAEQIADAVTAHLADTWEHVLQQESVERHAWGLLKAAVARWLGEHQAESAFIETAAFDRVARALARAREQFAVMEESLGLYTAIAQLPERQYDVIVLRYVLGYPDSRVAFLLGITEGTVRSHVRFAKRHLEHIAKDLGILHTTETEA